MLESPEPIGSLIRKRLPLMATRSRRPSVVHVVTAALFAATGTTLAAAIDAQSQAQAATKAAITAQAQAAAWQSVATAGGTKALPASVHASVQKATAQAAPFTLDRRPPAAARSPSECPTDPPPPAPPRPAPGKRLPILQRGLAPLEYLRRRRPR